MRKAECLYVLLKTWGDLALKSPETVASEFMCETSVDILDLAELGKATFCSAGIRRVVIFECNAMEEEDDFLR